MKLFFIIACAIAAIIPLLPDFDRGSGEARTASGRFLLDAEEFHETASDPVDHSAFSGFPGTIRSGRSARGPFLIREVNGPTRGLHSSHDCYRGSGYRVSTPTVEADAQGRQWAVFQAERSGEKLTVREIFVAADGQTWSDVSSWYWSALLKRSQGPWQAITRLEKS